MRRHAASRKTKKAMIKEALAECIVKARVSGGERAVRAVFVTPAAFQELRQATLPIETFIDDKLASMGFENIAVQGVAVCVFGDLRIQLQMPKHACPACSSEVRDLYEAASHIVANVHCGVPSTTIADLAAAVKKTYPLLEKHFAEVNPREHYE